MEATQRKFRNLREVEEAFRPKSALESQKLLEWERTTEEGRRARREAEAFVREAYKRHSIFQFED